MASVGVAPASGLRESQMVGVDRLPEEMNDMKIRDDKVQSFCSVLFFFSLSLSRPRVCFICCLIILHHLT